MIITFLLILKTSMITSTNAAFFTDAKSPFEAEGSSPLTGVSTCAEGAREGRLA